MHCNFLVNIGIMFLFNDNVSSTSSIGSCTSKCNRILESPKPTDIIILMTLLYLLANVRTKEFGKHYDYILDPMEKIYGWLNADGHRIRNEIKQT